MVDHVDAEASERALGRVVSVLWRIFVSAFLIDLVGLLVILSQGAQAPNTRVGNIAAGVSFAMMPVCVVAGLAIFFLNIRRIWLRLKSGQRFSDFDPWLKD